MHMERRRPDARTTLDGRHLHTPWVAAPQCQPTNADSRRGHIRTTLTTGPAGLPHPATWASLPDTGGWTIARNCPIAQVRYTFGAALSALRRPFPAYPLSQAVRPANLDIDDSTWSAPPPSLFVNMSRVYSVNTVNRLTGLFPHS